MIKLMVIQVCLSRKSLIVDTRHFVTSSEPSALQILSTNLSWCCTFPMITFEASLTYIITFILLIIDWILLYNQLYNIYFTPMWYHLKPCFLFVVVSNFNFFIFSYFRLHPAQKNKYESSWLHTNMPLLFLCARIPRNNIIDVTCI